MKTLFYEKETETIRQRPENYCIAYKMAGRWICEPDLAADRNLTLKVFNALWNHDLKYGKGESMLNSISPGLRSTVMLIKRFLKGSMKIPVNWSG